MKKIVIAGGSGFLGSLLTEYYSNRKTLVYILSRRYQEDRQYVRFVHWDGRRLGDWVKVLENADALINLSGKSVDCRYNEKNKQLIYASRIDTTRVLGEAIQECASPPKVWINAASATIYRHSVDQPMNELTGEYGSGFSVDVCQKWERTFNEVNISRTRKVVLRTGIVLGKNGGALQPLLNLVKIGLGGRQGKRNQYFSWLHEVDFARIVDFLIRDENVQGVFNTVAPNPIPNHQLMTELRSIVNVPFGIPLPKWLLKIGARLIQTETELILKSRRVVPTRLLQEGYRFEYPEIESPLKEIVYRHRSVVQERSITAAWE